MLWPATSAGERIAFRQINKRTGNRIRQQSIDEGTREPVEPNDKGKGYEIEKGRFLMVEEEELRAIQIESTKTIDIDAFVPRANIDEPYLDTPYYIAPNEKVGVEPFAVIREAMRGKDMVALGRVVLSSREHVIMLQPWNKGMLGVTLRYPYEVRNPDDYFHDIPDVKIDAQLLGLAEHILQNKAAEFEPDLFIDRYEGAVVELLEQKRKGMPNIVTPVSAPNVPIDLMAALKRSLAKTLAPANDGVEAKSARVKKAKVCVRQQGELMLPILGKKPAASALKAVSKRKAG